MEDATFSTAGAPSGCFPSTAVLSSDTAAIAGRQQYHTDVNQEGKGCNLTGFHIWKSALAVRGNPRPFPGKEAGTGAGIQAPF